MPNCAICPKEATVQYGGNGTPIPYCDSHLPGALRKPEYAAMVVPITAPAPVAPAAVEEAPAETPAPKPSKKSAKVEAPSEAPAEETPTETAPEEEPKQ